MKIRPAEFLLFVITIIIGLALFQFGHAKAAAIKGLFHGGVVNSASAAGAAGQNLFVPPQLQAKAAYVYDVLDQKVIYATNENAILPLASLTKLMTAVVASESAPATTTVVITKEALEEDGDNGLLVGERWRLSDLLNFTLTVSSNDGAHAIAAAVGDLSLKADGQNDQTGDLQVGNPQIGDAQSVAQFVGEMNTKAQSIGLTSFHFFNPTGLDLDQTQSGGYGSAKDVADLMAYILKNHPDLLEATTRDHVTVTSLSRDTHTVENSDEIINNLPPLLGSKTGNTDLAGGNLVIAFDAGIAHPVIISVLGSTLDGRFTDIQALASSTLQYFAQSANAL